MSRLTRFEMIGGQILGLSTWADGLQGLCRGRLGSRGEPSTPARARLRWLRTAVCRRLAGWWLNWITLAAQEAGTPNVDYLPR